MKNYEKKNTYAVNYSFFKSIVLLTYCFIIIFIGFIKFNYITLPTNSSQIPNPMVEVKTINEASRLVNFKVKYPKKLSESAKVEKISVINNELVSITYILADSTLTYRIGKGNEDISGDYNKYPTIIKETLDDVTTTFKGNNYNKYNLAIWQNNGFTFSLSSAKPFSFKEFETIFNSIT